MEKIQYIHGGSEIMEEIKTLWEELNKYHESVSAYFKDEFQTYPFEKRKTKLTEKYQTGNLRIDIAKTPEQPVGYIISGITDDGVGEIESIFIRSEFRNQGIGDELMRCSILWLEGEGVHSMVVDVAVGNEGAYDFYARFGFFPRVTRLKHRKSEYK